MIKVSKETWTEENEKCTKYFYNRIKYNETQSNVIELSENGKKLSEEEINTKIFDHYKSLFQKEMLPEKPQFWSDQLSQLPKLTQDEIQKLNKPVTVNELYITLTKQLKLGKSPGNDGLSVAFYRKMWKEVYLYLFRSLKEGIEREELAALQRQSIVTYP